MPDEENAPPAEGAEGAAEGAEGAEGEAPPPVKAPPKLPKTKPEDQLRILEEAKIALKAEEISMSLRKTRETFLKNREDERDVEMKNQRNQRMVRQREEDAPIMNKRAAMMENALEQVKLQEEWEKYLECNPLPDVASTSSLSTYLSELEEVDDEAHLEKPHEQVEKTLAICSKSEALSDLMDGAMGRCLQDSDPEKFENLTNYRNTLRDVSTAKLDRLTQGFLHQADLYANEEAVAVKSAGTDVVKFGLWVHTSAKVSRVKEINYEEIGISIVLPVALQKTRTCIRAIQMSYDHMKRKVSKEEDGKKKKKKKLDRFRAVGGVVMLDQFGLPPPPKEAKGWIMREITPLTKSLLHVPYPSKGEGGAASNQGVITLTYKIPEYIFVNCDYPEFGWYDETKGMWEREGVSCLSYDSKTRSATLQLGLLKPFAVVQPRALDFPYLFWSITTTANKTGLISVRGSRFSVELEVIGGKLQLLGPSEGVLKEHCNKLMDPGKLLLTLSRVGLNLIPNDDDAKFCRKAIKRNESIIHQHISKVAGVVDLQFSTWNGGCSTDKVVFEAKVAANTLISAPPPSKPCSSQPDDIEEIPSLGDDDNEEVPAEAAEEEEEEEEKPEDPTVPESKQDPKDWIRVIAKEQESTDENPINNTFFALVMKGEEFDEDQSMCTSQYLPDTFPQSSLRRALSKYLDAPENSDAVGISVTDSFEQLDSEAVMYQKTICRTLNLLRPFTFS